MKQEANQSIIKNSLSSVSNAIGNKLLEESKAHWDKLLQFSKLLALSDVEKLLQIIPSFIQQKLESGHFEQISCELDKCYSQIMATPVFSQLAKKSLIDFYQSTAKAYITCGKKRKALTYYLQAYKLAEEANLQDTIQELSTAITKIEQAYLASNSNSQWQEHQRLLQDIRTRFHTQMTAETDKLAQHQQQFTQEIIALLRKMAQVTQTDLGEPPCAYSWIAIGSISRDELYPYSDLDCALLIADESLRHHTYFSQLVERFQFRLDLLGEPNGLHIDAGDIGYLLSQERFLLNTPQGLASYVDPEKINTPEQYAQPEFYSLHRAVLLYASTGGEDLVKSYQQIIANKFRTQYALSAEGSAAKSSLIKGWKKRLRTYQQRLASRQNSIAGKVIFPLHREAAFGYLQMHRGQYFKSRAYWDNLEQPIINFKERYLSPLTYACLDIGLYYGFINGDNISISIEDVLTRLEQEHCLQEAFIKQIRKALTTLKLLRIKFHFHSKAQQDKGYKPDYTGEMLPNFPQLTQAEWRMLRAIDLQVLLPLYLSIPAWTVEQAVSSIDVMTTAWKQTMELYRQQLNTPKKEVAEQRLQNAIVMLAYYLTEKEAELTECQSYLVLLPEDAAIQLNFIHHLIESYQEKYQTASIPLSCLHKIPFEDGFKALFNPRKQFNKQHFYETIRSLTQLYAQSQAPASYYRQWLSYLPDAWHNYYIEQVYESEQKYQQNAERIAYIQAVLWDYPQADGRRIAVEKSCSHWQKQLAAILTNEKPATNAVKVIRAVPSKTSEGKPQLISTWLHSKVAEQLIDNTGYFKIEQKEVLPGRHTVIAIQYNSSAIHFKQFPELPGIEYAVGQLHRWVVGSGTPWTELIRFEVTVGKQVIAYPVLLSETIIGEDLCATLTNTSALYNDFTCLDYRQYSQMVLMALLINPEDGKPDNYIVSPINIMAEKRHRIMAIDNDHAFVESLIKSTTGQTQVQVKTILYCLDVMHQPFHPEVIEEFLRLDIGRVLLNWLIDLHRQQEAYQALFSDKEAKQLFSADKFNFFKRTSSEPVVISIFLQENLIPTLYQKMRLIQESFKGWEDINHLALLYRLDARLAKFYEQELEQDNTANERFRALTNKQYSVVMAGRYGTMVGSRQILQSALQEVPSFKDIQNRKKYHPQQALTALKNIQQQEREVDTIRAELLAGKVESYKKLQVSHLRERIINEISWNDLREDKIATLAVDYQHVRKELIILNAAKGQAFRYLKLANSIALDDKLLAEILKSSPELLELNISNCLITDKGIQNIMSACPRLEKLTIENWQGKELKIKSLHLRGLNISYSTQLQKITLDCPKLRWMNVEGCEQLADIDIKENNLSHVNLKGCEKILQREFKQQYPAFLTVKNGIPDEIINNIDKSKCSFNIQNERDVIFSSTAIISNKYLTVLSLVFIEAIRHPRIIKPLIEAIRKASHINILKLKGAAPVQIAKCVLVGDQAGDEYRNGTLLLFRYVTGRYPEGDPPKYFDNYSTNVKVDKRNINLILSEIEVSQEVYDRLRPLSYLLSDIFIVFFPISSPGRFENVRAKWVPEITHHCPSAPKILVGLNTECRDNKELIGELAEKKMKPITYEEGLQMSKEIGAYKYLECSARTGEGVQQVFEEAVRAVRDKANQLQMPSKIKDDLIISLIDALKEDNHIKEFRLDLNHLAPKKILQAVRDMLVVNRTITEVSFSGNLIDEIDSSAQYKDIQYYLDFNRKLAETQPDSASTSNALKTTFFTTTSSSTKLDNDARSNLTYGLN